MGNIRQQEPSLFSHGLVSTDKFPNVQTLLNFASWCVWNKLPFLDKSRKVFLNQYCSDILLRRGFRQHGVIKSVDFLVQLRGRLKTRAKQYARKKIIWHRSMCSVDSIHMSFAVSLFALLLWNSRDKRGNYVLCGFEGAIIFDFSHSDWYFSHAMPGRIEYLFQVTRSARTRVLVSIELQQNGLNVVKSALRWLQNLSIIWCSSLLNCFRFYVEWITFNPKGPLLIGS